MAEQQDTAQRTEGPTPKRLADARKKGDAPKSQEVTAAVMLGAGALALWVFGGAAAQGILSTGAAFIDHPHAFIINAAQMQRLWTLAALSAGASLGLVAAVFVAAAILANAAQARPVLTTERMKPSLSKISPVAGLKRIFGPSGLFNFAKGVGKLVIVAALFFVALWPDRALLVAAIGADADALLALIRMLILKLVGLSVVAMAVIAGLDFAFQRESWKKRLRMTKDEVRRELKETDGDPQIKARQRQLRDARMRRRMLAAVRDAAVVIMNPTHYAVALGYDMGSETAPVCVAKGVDDLALRMRAAASEHGVPVIENPPLARALHASVDIDEEIPIEHYEAVATVIGFIMKKSAQRP